MSYSRWSSSRWYTFWSSTWSTDMQYKFPTNKLRRSQVFEICDMPSYCITYGDLVDRSRSSVLREVEELFAKDFTYTPSEYNEESGKLEYKETEILPGKKPTWEELNELQDYFSSFLNDVDEHFKTWNFFKYEWLYPIRNKIIFRYKKLKQKYVKDRP